MRLKKRGNKFSNGAKKCKCNISYENELKGKRCTIGWFFLGFKLIGLAMNVFVGYGKVRYGFFPGVPMLASRRRHPLSVPAWEERGRYDCCHVCAGVNCWCCPEWLVPGCGSLSLLRRLNNEDFEGWKRIISVRTCSMYLVILPFFLAEPNVFWSGLRLADWFVGLRCAQAQLVKAKLHNIYEKYAAWPDPKT